tara:strand:- start:47 stop:163 length:117 start_codon:yes stop_codon:yes gene_type:complete
MGIGGHNHGIGSTDVNVVGGVNPKLGKLPIRANKRIQI